MKKKIDGRSKVAREVKKKAESAYICKVLEDEEQVEEEIVKVGGTSVLGRHYAPLEFKDPASALQTQIGGDHYRTMAIQPMEYSMKNNLDACQHTIIKYVSRFRSKGGIADLEKAKHVIDMLIEFERGA